MTIPALRDVPGVAAQAPAETTGFVFNHTMLRVKDIRASLDFYTRVLGFQLIDSYVGLTLCYVAFSLPIVVWLMRDFFEAIPIEVEEAAMVDNVPSWRIFLGIVVPMSMNGLLATFMITLAFVWNEFLFALFLTNSRWQTLPILVAGQNSQRGDEWWAISAAALVAIVPMMIMAGLLSRMMRSGLLLGAIK